MPTPEALGDEASTPSWQISSRASAAVKLIAPAGLSVTSSADGFVLCPAPQPVPEPATDHGSQYAAKGAQPPPSGAAQPPASAAQAKLAAGRYSLAVQVGGQAALQVTPICYPHIGRTRHVRPVTVEVLALDLTLPTSRVGFIDGGADRVGLWLSRMGVDVTPLDAAALEGDLTAYDTIVVGIFAYGTRPDLARANPRLKDWVRQGGHLVTLYHRPIDGWRSQETPPLPLSIGSPSLRWRVTNPAAPVTVLAPDHPLFKGPNRITLADFDGWDKERGLYFASSWDAAYVPLLSMSDAGEAPHLGSLLSAKIEKGRHTHSALALHHQIDRLVPGAIRLLANLLQKA